MGYEDVLQKTRKAARSEATALYLSDNQLTALPPEIAELTSLTALNLSRNQFTTLPPR